MKKKIVLFCIIASVLCNLTGCALKDKISNQVENSKELIYENRDSVAYINIWNEFMTPGYKHYFPDGKAYEEIYDDEIYDDWDSLTKLILTSTLYCNGNNFVQYCPQQANIKYYSGTYKIQDDNELDLIYQYYYYGSNGKEFYIDLKNETTNMSEGRHLISLVDDMNDASDYGYVLEVEGLFNKNDKRKYMSSPHYYNCRLETENWNGKYNPGTLQLRLYSKGGFLVAEQKGYTFDGDISDKEFTLKYDDTDLDIDYSCQFTIKFNSDNTWENDYDIKGYSGTWKLMYNNLLVVYPPKEDFYDSDISLLYLDFDKEEIYVPAYIRCDDMIKVAEEYEKNKTSG